MYYDDITQELLYIICLCLSLRQIWCNHTPLPVVTKYLLLLLTAIHIYRSNVSDKKYNFYFCSRSFDLYQWYTPLTSALAHADAIHLGMNGLSTYRLLPQLERIWGTNRTIAMILVITSRTFPLLSFTNTTYLCNRIQWSSLWTHAMP